MLFFIRDEGNKREMRFEGVFKKGDSRRRADV